MPTPLPSPLSTPGPGGCSLLRCVTPHLPVRGGAPAPANVVTLIVCWDLHVEPHQLNATQRGRQGRCALEHRALVVSTAPQPTIILMLLAAGQLRRLWPWPFVWPLLGSRGRWRDTRYPPRTTGHLCTHVSQRINATAIFARAAHFASHEPDG